MIALEVKTAVGKLGVPILVVNVFPKSIYLHVTTDLTFWQLLAITRLIRRNFPKFRILSAGQVAGMYQIKFGTPVL